MTTATDIIRARSGDSTLDRLKRAEKLEAMRPNNIESLLAVSQAALDAQDFAKARARAEAAARVEPSERVYLLLAEHAIEIVADRGLARQVPPGTWQALVAAMGDAFRRGDYEGGLTQALSEVSALLARYFPSDGAGSHGNELPDSPVLGRQGG